MSNIGVVEQNDSTGAFVLLYFGLMTTIYPHYLSSKLDGY